MTELPGKTFHEVVAQIAERHLQPTVDEVIRPRAQDCLNALGAGRPEHVYGNALAVELGMLCDSNPEQFRYDREYRISTKYKGHEVHYGVADFVLWACVPTTDIAFVIELKQGLDLDKTVRANDGAKRQLRQYVTDLRRIVPAAVYGVLLNFPLQDEESAVQARTLP